MGLKFLPELVDLLSDFYVHFFRSLLYCSVAYDFVRPLAGPHAKLNRLPGRFWTCILYLNLSYCKQY